MGLNDVQIIFYASSDLSAEISTMPYSFNFLESSLICFLLSSYSSIVIRDVGSLVMRDVGSLVSLLKAYLSSLDLCHTSEITTNSDFTAQEHFFTPDHTLTSTVKNRVKSLIGLPLTARLLWYEKKGAGPG